MNFQAHTLCFTALSSAALVAQAQLLPDVLPARSAEVQYAGSIGLFSVGAMGCSRNQRWGVGLAYGHTPRSVGGPLDTWTARFQYVPWQVRAGRKWQLDPVQTGLFIAYTRGLDLEGKRPSYIPKGYYWWLPNFRQHLYLRSELSRVLHKGTIARMGIYFEVNTNDLYVYSWWPNKRSLSMYDILFFGAGVRFHFRPPPVPTPTE